ncbi:MAG: MarR family transcriptional regulator [Zoogloeaceae bacterium]|nr:MarR family transcriptional regulator [Zoogloeaceae bacterium]MCW5615217.1 MarR family transcriptional regulator [Rhodocyclaceae bacterium]
MHLPHFEDRIHAVCERHPGLPRQAVVVTRMIRFLSGAIDARLSQLLTGEGLNCSSWSVLMMIYSDRTGTVRPSSIGQALSQSRAHMTRLADELVASGWVERLPDAADRRAVALRLSSEARQRMQLLLPRVWALYEEMLGGLEPASLDPLEASLRTLLSHIEQLPPIEAGSGRQA